MSTFNSPEFVDWISTLAISLGTALIIAGILSLLSGRLLGLAPEHKLWAFIVGFAFLASLASAPLSESRSWSDSAFMLTLPLLITFLYFLPTAAAINAGHPAFVAIFLLNLLFGWTLIGWLVALVWVFKSPTQPVAASSGYRITPFGAVPDRKPAGQPPKSA